MKLTKLIACLAIPLAIGCGKKETVTYSDTGGWGDNSSSSSSSSTGGSTCSDLQDYYNDCCYTCGSYDSYCDMYSGSTEAECESELQAWLNDGFDLYGTCYCD